ncbi:MAG: DUF3526 domain-containing protein, partial [Candidatus Latescibacterota bacterium]
GGLFALGMAVSSRAARSSTALVVLLLVWTVAAVLVPNGAPYVASLLREVPSEAAFARSQTEEAHWLYPVLLEAMAHYPPPPVRINREFVDSDRLRGDAPYCRALRAAPREALDWYAKGTLEGNQLIVAAMGRYWGIYDARFGALAAQRHLADLLRQLSPVAALRCALEELTDQGFTGYLTFERQAEGYHRELRAALLATYPLRPDEPMQGEALAKLQAAPLRAEMVPPPPSGRRSTAEGLVAAAPDLAILALYAGLSFVFALTVANHQSVTGQS